MISFKKVALIKIKFYLFLSFSFAFIGNSIKANENQLQTTNASFSLASWNIKWLYMDPNHKSFEEQFNWWKPRNKEEIKVIATILSRYDLIAIQEVLDVFILKKLKQYLPNYQYQYSPSLGGNLLRERYAFFYRDNVTLKEIFLFKDTKNIFHREPFIGCFVVGNFDFVLINFHAIRGKGKRGFEKRINEINALKKIIDTIKGDEKDLILLGDFNLVSHHKAWKEIKKEYQPIIPFETKTTLRGKHAIDNIWIHSKHTKKEYIKVKEIYLFENESKQLKTNLKLEYSLERIQKRISDHYPISALFHTRQVDDDFGEIKKKQLQKINLLK